MVPKKFKRLMQKQIIHYTGHYPQHYYSAHKQLYFILLKNASLCLIKRIRSWYIDALKHLTHLIIKF